MKKFKKLEKNQIVEWHSEYYQLLDYKNNRFIYPTGYCWKCGTKTFELLNLETNFVCTFGLYPVHICPKCYNGFFIDIFNNPHPTTITVKL